jgi:hypothetical protein
MFAVAVLFVLGAAIWLAYDAWPVSNRTTPGIGPSNTTFLTCADSAGQQGRGDETVVGGVEGLALRDSGNPANLNLVTASDGQRYYFDKVFLAVSHSVAPYANVTILRPSSARLIYGPSVSGDITSRAVVSAMVAASRRRIRMPICGPRYTGFVGAIIVARPALVTFSVSSPHRRIDMVTVPIGNS